MATVQEVILQAQCFPEDFVENWEGPVEILQTHLHVHDRWVIIRSSFLRLARVQTLVDVARLDSIFVL